MKHQLDTIVHNLKECFDGKPWYGIPLMNKLNAVPWQLANDKTYASKSIAVLVKHILNWRIFVIKKLEGDAVYTIVIDGENDWDEISIESEGDWQALLGELQDSQDRLIGLLNENTDQLLAQQVPGKSYTFGPILTSIAQHDIYHLGQIAMLNSMKQG